MKKTKYILLVMLFASAAFGMPSDKPLNGNLTASFPIQQVGLSANNISSFFYNTGIFDQDMRTSNTPGFEWPKGSGKSACFTSGLNVQTKIEGLYREASCSYHGEYTAGYINNSSGSPVAVTNSDFKIYKINSSDNANNNPDYANWYKMVPYGAPYEDINNNGVYDNGVDKPGVKNASSTLFACLTDGFAETHTGFEGFGGGTPPIFCEMHFTAWAYNSTGLEDVQFVRWVLVNKNNRAWESTYMGVFADADVGYANDDYIGCDVNANLGYTYNADNDDAGNTYSYGANPPAFGIDLLKSPLNRNVSPAASLNMTSFVDLNVTCPENSNPHPSFMQGYKNDGTPFIDPLTMQTTKFCYPGNPEANSGWTERTGSVQNCGGSLTGTIIPVNPAGDRRFLMSSGADNFKVMPNESQELVIAQMVARGTSNFNSVTKLKQLDNLVQVIYNSEMSVNNISSIIPSAFSLYQNYPNPFNPTTNIKFDMVKSGFATLKIFDASGKEVAVLVNNEPVSAGTNQVTFDAKNLSSGIYFYTLSAGDFVNTKKMLLLK